MNCRVCRTDNDVREFGRIQPYDDYACMVYHCDRCGSRFTERDASIYETLHGDSGSSYSYHRDVATKAAEAYRNGDRDRLRAVLSKFPKNKFIMNQLDGLPPDSNLLEIGCSRGYLTSYFLLSGHRVLGTDVSESAVEGATEHFGPNFCVAGSELIDERAPFDAIYHVGTIGCVESPMELTDQLLTLLKPGGILAFNAPNVQAAEWQQLAWVRGTYPPDLVCLFHPDLWESHYGKSCDVTVTIENAPLNKSISDARLRGKEVVAAGSFAKSGESNPNPAAQARNPIGRKFDELVRRTVNSLTPIASGLCRPSDFGLYVVMRKRN